MNKLTAIVCGATGQLGQFLIKYLLELQPHIQVIGTIRHKSYDTQPLIYDKSKVIFELMDLSDSISIDNLIIKYKPNYMFNTAANAFVGESWSVPVQHFQINTIGVLNQLESIRKHSPHTRYLNMGSSEEQGTDFNDGQLQDENTPLNPKSPYACSKAAARFLVNTYRKSYGLYVLQPWSFNFESELRGPKYVTRKITQGVAKIYNNIKNNESFEPIQLGNLNSYRSWQYAGDVAEGLWKILNQDTINKHFFDENNIQFFDDTTKNLYIAKTIKNYVLSATTCHTVRDFVQLAFKKANIDELVSNKEFKWRGEGVSSTFWLGDKKLVEVNKEFIRPHDVTYLNGDASAIKRDLNWQPTVTFDQLVGKMVEHDLKESSQNS